jgi:hypothetical protein
VHTVKKRKKKENKCEVGKRGERKEYKNNLNDSRIISAHMLQILLTLRGNIALFLSERKRNEQLVVAK